MRKKDWIAMSTESEVIQSSQNNKNFKIRGQQALWVCWPLIQTLITSIFKIKT
jgi:hypothetical protein